MDYEKKYKEALEKAKDMLSYKEVRQEDIEYLFPELKKSEDEKIRKELIGFLRNIPNSNYTCEEMALWLEKQGAKHLEAQPRYSIGDVICDKSCTTLNKEAQPNMEIVDIQNGIYICDKGSFPVSQQDEYELVGKKIDSKLNDDSVSNELRTASFKYAEKEILNPTFPDNKEFELVYTFEEGAKWQATQKSSWSKDDDDNLGMIEIRLIDLLSYTRKDNSLTKHRKNTIEEEVVGYVNWLTSLKARFTWKPSNEQMDALEYHLKHTNENSRLYKETKKLYDQLKKLNSTKGI